MDISKQAFNKRLISFPSFLPTVPVPCWVQGKTVAVGVTPTHAWLFTGLEEYTSDYDLHTKPRRNNLNYYTILIKIELMKFESTHIKGKGRGKPMGFPTINLKIPDNFELKDGVYAVKVSIEKNFFTGALHYGLVPTFREQEKSLEVYLIGVNELCLPAGRQGLENLDGKIIKVEIIKYLRPIIKFRLVEELVRQIEEDVKNIQKIRITNNQ